MRLVDVTGWLMADKPTHFMGEGYLQNNYFYPDKTDTRVYYILVKCQKHHVKGTILVQHMEYIDDD